MTLFTYAEAATNPRCASKSNHEAAKDASRALPPNVGIVKKDAVSL